MTLYWLLFLLPAICALIVAQPRYSQSKHVSNFSLKLFLCGLALTIGLRHEVGGDWRNYLPYVASFEGLTLQSAISMKDPAYALLNWIGANWGGGIYFVNAVCGLIFSFGLILFCRQLPRPWLAIAIAMPYLMLVVAMGYSRQGVAIGIAMWGLTLLQKNQVWRFALAIFFASLFHKSAVALLLIAIVAKNKNKFLIGVAILGLGVGLYFLLIADAVEALKIGYLDAEYQSSGAVIRIALKALRGTLVLIFRKRFVLTKQQLKLWTYMAVASIIFIGLLFISPSSTAVDRVALYLIPLQLFVWSHMPDVMGNVQRKNVLSVLMILGFYACVLFVWLFFADHRSAWIPYKFLPLEVM